MRVILNLRSVCRGMLLGAAWIGMAVGQQSMAGDKTYNTNETWDSGHPPYAANNNIKLNGASGVPTTLTIDGITAPTSGAYSSLYTAATTAYEANVVVQNGAKYFSGASYIGDTASSISHLTVTGPGSEWTSAGMQIARQSSTTATLDVSSSGKLVTTGSFQIAAGSTSTATVNITGGSTASIASLTVGQGTSSDGKLYVTNATATLSSTLTVGYGSNSTGIVSVTSGGALTSSTLVIGESSGSNGAITVNGSTSSLYATGSVAAIAKAGTTGTLNVTGGALVTLTGGANVATTASGTGTVNVASGSTLKLGTTGTGNMTVGPSGTSTALGYLTGRGTIDVGALTNYGTITPGDGATPGLMTILGNLTNKAGASTSGELAFNLAGPASYDQLSVAGTLSFVTGNTIEVTLDSGYTPAFNTVFNLLDWTTVSGLPNAAFNFTNSLPADWDVTTFATNGEIKFVGVPEPASATLLLFGMLGACGFARKHRRS